MEKIYATAWLPGAGQYSVLRIKPLIRWQKQRLLDNGVDSPPVDIANAYHEWQSLAGDLSSALSDGWAQSEQPKPYSNNYCGGVHGYGAFTRPDHITKTFGQGFSYEHREMEGSFAHPWPLAWKDGSPLDLRAWSPLLSFQAQACQMILAPLRDPGGPEDPLLEHVNYDQAAPMGIWSRRGPWAGALFSDGKATGLCIGMLIAISKASVNREDPNSGRSPPFRKMTLHEDIKTLDPYCFYNVLWIEWQGGGPARRKGVGRVWDQEWEAECPQMMDITLG